MKTTAAILIVLFGLSAYDYTRPATCRVSTDISMEGRIGQWEKCSTPYGVYYTEHFIRYID